MEKYINLFYFYCFKMASAPSFGSVTHEIDPITELNPKVYQVSYMTELRFSSQSRGEMDKMGGKNHNKIK